VIKRMKYKAMPLISNLRRSSLKKTLLPVCTPLWEWWKVPHFLPLSECVSVYTEEGASAGQFEGEQATFKVPILLYSTSPWKRCFLSKDNLSLFTLHFSFHADSSNIYSGVSFSYGNM
jgi:hypothetical protein